MLLSHLFEEETTDTMTLWHGGRGLDMSYKEMRPHTKGNWEHGPGLYLTTHYETALDYAKGGNKIFQVTIKKGKDINGITIPLEDGIDFVKRYCIGRYRKQIIQDFNDNIARRGGLFLSSLVNLIFNYQAVSIANTVKLRQFIVDHGADYEIVSYKGPVKIVVLFNPELIKSVKAVKSKDVSVDDYVKPITEKTNSPKITEGINSIPKPARSSRIIQTSTQKKKEKN